MKEKNSESPCHKCPMRAKFDKSPKSIIGRIWRWHINFCPGWKSHTNSLPADEQDEIRRKYNLHK